MYARFLISLAMLSIALTISAIHIYSSTQKYYSPFVQEQESLSSKTGFQFYAIPPTLTIASIKALYVYENYVWDSIKTSNLVTTGVNGNKIIKWVAERRETQESSCCGGMMTRSMGNDCMIGVGPIVLVCTDRDSAGNCICNQETFAYIRTYLNFFTNVTKRKYLKDFVEYLENYGNLMLNTLNNYNKEKFGDDAIQYTIDNVEVIPLVNITNPVVPNKTAVLLVIYIVDVEKKGHTIYKFKVPFEIDIRVKVLGDLKNSEDQKFAIKHIISYAYVDKIKDVNGRCSPPTKTEPIGVPSSTSISQSCCIGSGKHCTPVTCSVTVNQWSSQRGGAVYSTKEKVSVTFSKAGYTGLHYVYRIVNRIVYRQDLTNIPFRSYDIHRIYDMVLTPFSRTSGYVYDRAWVVNDTWVYRHSAPTGDACFAKYETPNSWGSYGLNGMYKGLPNGGYCNGYSYYISNPGVDTISGSISVPDGLSVCRNQINMFHPCVCGGAYDVGRPPNVPMFVRRCLRPVSDTINHELMIHNLIVDDFCWNQTNMNNRPFNC